MNQARCLVHRGLLGQISPSVSLNKENSLKFTISHWGRSWLGATHPNMNFMVFDIRASKQSQKHLIFLSSLSSLWSAEISQVVEGIVELEGTCSMDLITMAKFSSNQLLGIRGWNWEGGSSLSSSSASALLLSALPSFLFFLFVEVSTFTQRG